MEQEERRNSVEGRKVKHARPQQEGFSAVGAVALWSVRRRQHTLTRAKGSAVTARTCTCHHFAHMQLVEEHSVGVPSRLRRFPELLLGRVAVHGTQSEQAVCTEAHKKKGVMETNTHRSIARRFNHSRSERDRKKL